MGILQSALVVALFALAVTSVHAGDLQIPIQAQGAPAVDLLHNGRLLDRDEALDLQESGTDLSTLDPKPSDVWGPAKLSASDITPWNYPIDGASLRFDSITNASEDLFRARVVAPDGTVFLLYASKTEHASLTRSALMRKLGYSIPSPQHFRKVTIQFASQEERTAFHGALVESVALQAKRWIVSEPENSTEATLQDVILEPAQIDITPYHWGIIRPDYIEGRRTVRALAIPIVLGDINESVNGYAWELGKVLNETVVLKSAYASRFGEITYPDARWIARRITALTRRDFTEIVEAGKYPADISALLVEKLIARRNHLVDVFEISAAKIPYQSKISVGSVKKGKLTQEWYDGYSLRFTYGDLQSPLRTGELARFLLTQATTVGLQQVVSRLNAEIQVLGMQQIGENHVRQLSDDIRKFCAGNPQCKYERPVQTFGGPLLSGGVQANRSVITGGFYGGESKIQLVDSLGASVSAGYFMGINGVPKVLPGVAGNVSIQRNYVHVRPIGDMKEALKVDWKQLLVPNFMAQLAKKLDDGNVETDDLKAFIEALKPDEMFVVTDSVMAGLRASVTVPIAPLINMQFFGWKNTGASFGAGGTVSVIKRTTFLRTAAGLQIYFQDVDAESADFSFDFNYFINVLRLSQTRKHGEAVTRAYIFEDLPTEAAPRLTLGRAIRSVLKSNNSELLEENFGKYLLRHNSSSHTNRGKFLFWRWNSLEEEHRVRIRPPVADECVRNPLAENCFNPASHERTLLSHRIKNTVGKNFAGFFSEITSYLAPKYGFSLEQNGDNPSASFMGSAKWRSVQTEAEVTPGRQSKPVTLVEHHWGGWMLSTQGLVKLLGSIERKMLPLNLERPLSRKDELLTAKWLQMYEVASTLILYESGMEQVRKLFSKETPIRQVYLALIELSGTKEFEQYCRRRDRPMEMGPLARGTYLQGFDTYMEEERGIRIGFTCVMPWMREMFELRKKQPNELERQIKWSTKLIRTIDSNGDISRILAWLGPANYFFQVRVQGFRKVDNDSDPEYISDSIGSVDPTDGAGVFRDFANDTHIMSHELYARYLTEGF